MSRPFIARFGGRCPACESGIHPGKEVEYSTDVPLVHADCSDAAPEPIEGVACPRCFLRRSLSGDCGCDS